MFYTEISYIVHGIEKRKGEYGFPYSLFCYKTEQNAGKLNQQPAGLSEKE